MTILAISLSTLGYYALYIIVVGLIFWLLLWLIDYAGVPQPFNKVAKVILAVVAVILLINLIAGMIGEPFIKF